jgi:uroporphyrin-III C-methyltransferase
MTLLMPKTKLEIRPTSDVPPATPLTTCAARHAPGMVYLVGAGPGAADLITLKGLRCLRRADIVVYDRLIDPTLLEEAPPAAERIYVGKGPHCHAEALEPIQERINALLVTRARRGRTVVRLKGGDPFVFGRGGEEALALAAAGIPFEIVPGVSSAIAVPAYAGIPVTHRGLASHFTVVTGHMGWRAHQPVVGASGEPDGAIDGIDWEALARMARPGGTLVILMGLATLPASVRRLLAAGLDPETPAAVIQQGTTPSQRIVTDRLAEIVDRVAAAKLESPALTIIGAVVDLLEALAWFAAEPLPATHA